MKVFVKELNETFETKEYAFKALKENKDILIQAKKTEQKSSEKSSGVPLRPFKLNEEIKGLDTSDGMIHIVVSTTNVIDSHDDLHVKGCFNKTAKEQVGKVALCVDHDLSIMGVAVRKEHIKLSVLDTTFKALGFDLKGETQAYVYSFHESNLKHEKAREWLKSGDSIDGSIRMQYLGIDLALKSDAEEDKTERKSFDDYSKVIANKSDDVELLYFWVVKELKNVGESSLVETGSNIYTGVLEPSKDTQKASKININNIIGGLKVEKKEGLNFIYLLENIK